MKNKVIKILAIVSFIVLLLGTILFFSANTFVDKLLYSKDSFMVIIGIMSALALKLLIIFVTFSIISLIWIIYGIVILIKKIKEKGINWKSILLLLLLILVLVSFIVMFYNVFHFS